MTGVYKPFDVRRRQVRRSNKIDEGLVRRTVSDDIVRAGLTVDKIEQRAARGMPDMYIEGGNWMELKFLPDVKGRGLGMNVTNRFTPKQKDWLGRRPSYDRKFAGMLFVSPQMEARLVIIKFITLYGFDKDQHRWTFPKARLWGCDFFDDAARFEYVSQTFGKRYERGSNWSLHRLEMRHSQMDMLS